MPPVSFPIATAVEGIVIREYTEDDFEQCKHIFAHTQSLNGNPSAYVEKSLETDMKDIRKNYLEITELDTVLPTSLDKGASAEKESAPKKGTWLVAVDTNNNGIICGQVALHPLIIAEPDVYKYYTEKREQCASQKLPTPPHFPYNLNIPVERVAELRRMAVLPEYQAKRIGSELMKAFELVAKEQLGYSIIHLVSLLSMGKAVAFYKRQGFRSERLELLTMGIKDEEGKPTNLKSIVDQREIIGGPESLTEKEQQEGFKCPKDSSTLYVIHYWKEL